MFHQNGTFLDSTARPSLYKKGQAMLVATLFFITGSMIILGGVAQPLLQDKQNIRQLIESKQSYFFAEGSVEDVVYRVSTGRPVSSSEFLVSGIYSATTTITDVAGTKEIEARGDVFDAIRKVRTTVVEGDGVAFTYGMQSDAGGIALENSASIVGSVFSNGPIIGETSNSVSGEVISAGPSGFISGINLGGSAYANTIEDIVAGGDAYYQTILGSTVSGTLYPDSTEQATSSLPITDEMIDSWKAQALAGGVIAGDCPYLIKSDVTLGPIKIECDLEVRGNPTVLIAGMIWVEGNIDIQNNPVFRADSSLGNASVAVIADNPNNQSGSGIIRLRNSSVFEGNGEPNSYILFVSQNNSAEIGGDEEAITIENGAEGDLLVYAAHGEINIKNNVSLKEVTAWRIEVENNAQIVYDSGIANLLFTTGPQGGFSISRWEEVE